MMNQLFNQFIDKKPNYCTKFQKPLFEGISVKGGGSESKKTFLGKHFSNNYELYLYAFFLGYYSDRFEKIKEDEPKRNFNHEIKNWGHVERRAGRKNYSDIQKYVFMALVVKTDFDFIQLEKGEFTDNEAAKALIETMEGYTNGGLQLIYDKLQDESDYFISAPSFLDFIMKNHKSANL